MEWTDGLMHKLIKLLTFLAKTRSKMRRLTCFPAKMTLVHARALLSIEKIL